MCSVSHSERSASITLRRRAHRSWHSWSLVACRSRSTAISDRRQAVSALWQGSLSRSFRKMQKELQEAGDAGFKFVGVTVAKTAFGGKEVVSILRKEIAD